MSAAEPEYISLTPEYLPAFEVYLLRQASAAIAAGEYPVVAVGAVLGEHSCGAAAGLVSGDTLELFSLFTDVTVRRRGLGAGLLAALAAACPEGTERIEALYTLPDAEAAELAAFLVKNGFDAPTRHSSVYELKLARLRSVPVLARALRESYRPDSNVRRLTEVSAAELALFETRVSPALAPSRFESCLIPELSLCYRYGGRLVGCIVATPGVDGSVVLSAAEALEDAPPAAFLQLAMAFAHKCAALLGEDGSVFVSAVSERSTELLQALVGTPDVVFGEYSASRRLSR